MKKDTLLTNITQSNNSASMLYLLQTFEPLIQKYTYLLSYDQAKSDLTIFLIETIRFMTKVNLKNDGQVVNYIQRAIQHQYIKLSKNQSLLKKEVSLDNVVETSISDFSGQTENHLLIDKAMKNLTPLQHEIIEKLYFEELSETTIAQQHHCTKQAICNIKKRALMKMRQNLK